jgi:hypothetical protein
MELHDTTYSNMNTSRCYAGQKTGEIHKCTNEDCEALYIDDWLSGEFYNWSY